MFLSQNEGTVCHLMHVMAYLVSKRLHALCTYAWHCSWGHILFALIASLTLPYIEISNLIGYMCRQRDMFLMLLENFHVQCHMTI